MRHRTLKLGLVAGIVMGFLIPLTLAATPAYADYSPGKGDIVGVGSDTLQYMLDFMADGDAYGDTGYNTIGNKNKLVSIDATTDANARLAYGVAGGQGTPSCTPGTGSTVGTGNSTTSNTGYPCVLNPTVVLRAGLQPVQRPNGSGAGFNALVQDMMAGHNGGNNPEVINFSRASSAQTNPTGLPSGVDIDQLEVATDTLPMLTATGSNAVPLSPSQLSLIYSADTGSCITWSDPRISGVYMEGASVSGSTITWTVPTGDTQVPTSANANGTWDVEVIGTGATIPGSTTISNVSNTGTTYTLTMSQAATTGGSSVNIGLVNPKASTDAIIPIIPQLGSGTRSFFLKQLVPTPNPLGTCPQVAEENDPTAVYDVVNGSTTLDKDTIEPMSQGRLDVYQGVRQNGTSGGIGGYFLDPSCPYVSGNASCGSGTVSTGGWKTNPVLPSVESWNSSSDVPVGLGAYDGTGAGGGLFNQTRPLYLYFRNSDITSKTPFQPGSTENWLNTLFYDPCEPGQTCTGTNGIYGPDGPPFIESGAGAAALSAAGVTEISPQVCMDISTGNSLC